ncbi:unnamed protein product, partial [marine sediment metagenome]
IDEINQKLGLGKEKDKLISQIDFTAQQQQIIVLLAYAKEMITELTANITNIETDLMEKGFKGDIPNLLAKADSYQRAIEQSRAAIVAINEKTLQFRTLIKERVQSVRRIMSEIRVERD